MELFVDSRRPHNNAGISGRCARSSMYTKTSKRFRVHLKLPSKIDITGIPWEATLWVESNWIVAQRPPWSRARSVKVWAMIKEVTSSVYAL